MIGDKAQSLYLAQIQAKENIQFEDAKMDAILRTHLIEPSFLRTDGFEGFIKDRKHRLTALISEVMGKSVSVSDKAAIATEMQENPEEES